MRRPARQPSEVERLHPPLAVFESYIKGLLTEIPATAISYLNAALAAQPTFDRARLALWDVYAEQGDHANAVAAVLPVAANSPWSRRARFLAALSYLHLNKYDEAFAGFKAIADAQPTAAAWNNLGVVQVRRGTTPQTALASFYFNKAVETDSNDADYFFNLGYAYWITRDPQAAIHWLREAVRRNPADGDAHFILGASLAAGGSTTEASRERELARRLSSKYEQWEKRPPAEAVPKGLERIKDGVELPHARQVEAALATSDQRELAQFYLDRGRRLFQQENDREAIVELNRALFLAPYAADAHLLVGRIHLRNNRLRDAIDAFKISLWSSETAQAHVALGEAYLQAKDMAGGARGGRTCGRPGSLVHRRERTPPANRRAVTVLKSRELAHHVQDDAFHEIQLNGKQLVFLFMVTTVVLAVAFLSGVFVGRGVRLERAATFAEAGVVSPVTTPDLVASQEATPAAGSDPTAAPPPPAVDELSYFSRLEKQGQPEEDLKPAAGKAAPAPAAAARAEKPRDTPPPAQKARALARPPRRPPRRRLESGRRSSVAGRVGRCFIGRAVRVGFRPADLSAQ